MSNYGPFVLVPRPVDDAVLGSCSVAEPAVGELAWVSAATYAIGDACIRVETHRAYVCLAAHSGSITPPEADPLRWKDVGPTRRWAMFDTATSAGTFADTALSVVLQPGFFNAVALYGCVGAAYSVVIRDQPGGTVVHSFSGDLYEPWGDWYGWLFGPYRPRKKIVLRDLVPYPDAELTITITAGPGAEVGVGLLCLGDLRGFVLSDQPGGTEHGARVEPVDFSYIKTDEFGETRIVKRRATTDLTATVWLPHADADYAAALIQEVLATPVAFVAVDAAGYETLTVFGLLSGSVSRDSGAHAVATVNVKGLL